MVKDTEARALLDAICGLLVEDMHFMPQTADLLRVRFEQALKPRGMLQREPGVGRGRESRNLSG